MKQITKAEAKAIGAAGEWKTWTDEQLVAFQLYQDKLAVPFERLQIALEHVLGRPVWTHEFANLKQLRAEHQKKVPAPTMADIIGMIPADKRIIVTVGDSDGAKAKEPTTEKRKGRPRLPKGQRRRRVQIMLQPRVIDALDVLAKRYNRSRSRMIEDIVTDVRLRRLYGPRPQDSL